MDIQSVIDFVKSQPVAVDYPFGIAVLADWWLGSLLAAKQNVFAKENWFQWVRTTVGWEKAMAVSGATLTIYLTRGQSDALAYMLPAAAVSGAAFAVVLADIKTKVMQLATIYFGKSKAEIVAPVVDKAIDNLLSKDAVRGVPEVTPTDAKN